MRSIFHPPRAAVAVIGLAVAALSLAGSAEAATIAFAGTEMNDTPPPAPSPSCGAGQVLVAFSPATATESGTSNFGTFLPTQSHCLTPPPTSYSGGVFDFAFTAGDDLTGTYSGHFTPTGTPNVLNTFIDYIVTGGTGRFLGATGEFDATGILDRSVTRPLNNVTFTGELILPAVSVPEPATWGLLLAGFAAMGAMLRRRRRVSA